MKPVYQIRLGKGALVVAKLTETTPGRVVTIDWLHVPPTHRGQGLASKILKVVLADADKERLTVRLVSKSCAQDGNGLDQSALDAFYGRFGFVSTGRRCPDHHGMIMERRSA